MEEPQRTVVITRKRWLAYMLPSVLFVAAWAGAAVWLTGEFRFVAAPLGVLAMWAMLHVLTPRSGQAYATIRGTPGTSTMLWFCGASLLLMALLVATDLSWSGRSLRDPLELYHAAVFLPPFVLLIVGACLADRQRGREQADPQESR